MDPSLPRIVEVSCRHENDSLGVGSVRWDCTVGNDYFPSTPTLVQLGKSNNGATKIIVYGIGLLCETHIMMSHYENKCITYVSYMKFMYENEKGED